MSGGSSETSGPMPPAIPYSWPDHTRSISSSISSNLRPRSDHGIPEAS
jgi:hypothetical protein